MHHSERITGGHGKVPDLLVVVGVGVVVVAVGPQPELGVGVEGVGEDGDRVQGLHEVPDVGHLWLAEGLGPTESLVAGVVTHTGLRPVEIPVPVGIHSVALALRRPRLPPQSVSVEAILVAVRVGRGQEVPVDVVQIVRVLGVVLDQLVDNEGGHGGGDPLPGVNPGLQPDVGLAGASLGEGQHLHVSPLVTLADVNDARPLIGVRQTLDEHVEVSVRVVVGPVKHPPGCSITGPGQLDQLLHVLHHDGVGDVVALQPGGHAVQQVVRHHQVGSSRPRLPPEVQVGGDMVGSQQLSLRHTQTASPQHLTRQYLDIAFPYYQKERQEMPLVEALAALSL